MPMLAFFPWLKIKNNFDINEFTVIKSEKFEKVFLKDNFKNVYEKIIKSCYINNDNPINEFTLIFLKNKDIFKDFADNEIESLFSFTEILAFSGLSNRQFFTNFSYYNSSNFNFIIQSFEEDSKGITIVSRRRDGQTKSFIYVESYKVIKPFYVYNDIAIEIDINSVKSLLEAKEELEDKWINFSDAIFFFNRANTDSNQISEHQEVVMMIGAIQRILMCNNGKIKELIENFNNTFRPKKDFDISKSRRIKKYNYKDKDKINTLRETWLKDFYRLRGDYAHGKKQSKIPLT